MRRILIWTALAFAATTAGCQQAPIGWQRTIRPWDSPCTWRPFEAGYCDNLNGLKDANYHLQRRILEGY
jgi:hypothetical protein